MRSLPGRHVDVLRDAVGMVRVWAPFQIDAFVVLPEHLHCVWTLPAGDGDFAGRWGAIKSGFSRLVPGGEFRSDSRIGRRERGIWQRRFWEHTIRDDADYAAHVNYVHFNPVKHGLVTRVADWPYSTFHRAVAAGRYPVAWAGDGVVVDGVGED